MPQTSLTSPAARQFSWTHAPAGRIAVGSRGHRDLFCRMLLDTFDPYKPAVIDWPALSGDELERLTGLPFWSLAVRTEGLTALRMQSFADTIGDKLIREAVALNAFEERRHKEILHNMIRFYGIEIEPEPDYVAPARPLTAFIQTGYGECFDSFFAFGLFKLAKDSGYFTPALVEVFEPVIQEEARHILFFVNWLRYMQKNRNILVRPLTIAHRIAAIATKLSNRLGMARGGTNNAQMTRKGHKAMGITLTPRGFLQVCLEENTRRLGAYDPRLLQPLVIPRLVRLAMPFLKK